MLRVFTEYKKQGIKNSIFVLNVINIPHLNFEQRKKTTLLGTLCD